MRHYYAIAEAAQDGSWWITFPGRDGITSVAPDATLIVARACEALASAAMHGGRLPSAIEDGMRPPDNLSDYAQPAMVIVVPFVPAVAEAAAN